jgi:methyl-accepting chemotaxis protein
MLTITFENVPELKAKFAALERALAVIELKPDGTIIGANNNFLAVMGYRLEEIAGRHHSIFVNQEYSKSAEYKQFWKKLAAGEPQEAEFLRFNKQGEEVWIHATYAPVKNSTGNTVKIINIATDITERKKRTLDMIGKIEAVEHSQATIEFTMEGIILSANQHFLQVMGYSLDEIHGKHHSMFVDPAERESEDYKHFWKELNHGASFTSEYKRLGKNGNEVWIQATYLPVMDANGKPYKVLKIASDITEQVQARRKNEAIKETILQNLSGITLSIQAAAEQSSSATHLSEQTSSNVQAVAAAAEELDASVAEISSNMSRSHTAVEDVFEKAHSADEAAQRLNKTTESMGGIIELIKDIAEQINLLALNATIESARAGEAGKGFAVVASEVKNLATETTKAIEQISKEIVDMQHVSGEVFTTLSTIRNSIENVREYVTSVAGAVDEQSAVTSEISQNMQHAAKGVSSICDNIAELAKANHQANESAQNIENAIGGM